MQLAGAPADPVQQLASHFSLGVQMALVHIGVPESVHAELARPDSVAAIARLESRVRAYIDAHANADRPATACGVGSAEIGQRAAGLHGLTSQYARHNSGVGQAYSTSRAHPGGLPHSGVHPTQSILLATPPSQRPDAVDFAALHAMRLSPAALAPAGENARMAAAYQLGAQPQPSPDPQRPSRSTATPAQAHGDAVAVSPPRPDTFSAPAPRIAWQQRHSVPQPEASPPPDGSPVPPISVAAQPGAREQEQGGSDPGGSLAVGQALTAAAPAAAELASRRLPCSSSGAQHLECSPAAVRDLCFEQRGPDEKAQQGAGPQDAVAGAGAALGAGLGPWRLLPPKSSSFKCAAVVDLSQSPQATADILQGGGAPAAVPGRTGPPQPAVESSRPREVAAAGTVARPKRRGSGWQKRRQQRSTQVCSATRLTHPLMMLGLQRESAARGSCVHCIPALVFFQC